MKLDQLQKTPIRMSYDSTGHPQGRSLALPISAPVLEQYNYIQLRKQPRRRRIDHLVLSELPVLTQSKSQSSRRGKWEQSLDRYILAKEKMQSRRAQQQSSEFQFLRLNKINKYRKIKLMEANSLPLSIIDTSDLHQTYSFDLHDPQIPKARRVSTEKDAHSVIPQPQLQQERIMNSILQNYFKKKYSQPQHRNIQRSDKYSSALLKKQKRKIKL